MLYENNCNILILHAHWNNRGDEAAIRAMIDSLRSKLHINNMEIMTIPSNISQFPYDDIPFVDMYPDMFPVLSKISFLDSLLCLLTYGKLSFTREGKSYLDSLNRIDIVIHAPGGPSIGDMYGGIIRDYPYLCRLLIAIFKGKSIYFYAPSMGPFKNRLLNVARKFILKKSKLIVLREELSANYLKEQIGLNSYVTIDSAFQNKISENYISKFSEAIEIQKLCENQDVVGLTITDLKWHPKYGSNNDINKQIVKSIVEFVEFLVHKGYTILLIPQLFGEEDDTLLLQKFKSIDEGKVIILSKDIDAYAQQVIISKLFSVIGMRYHSNIFAAKHKIPFISIYYEHKMKGFMEKLGLTDLMINVDSISSDEIIKRFIYLEQRYTNIQKHLEKHVPILMKESQATTELIVDSIKVHMTSKVNNAFDN